MYVCLIIVNHYDVLLFVGQVTAGQTTILVSVTGTVKFQANKAKNFTQNFMLTTQNSNWKVASDCLRLTD